MYDVHPDAPAFPHGTGRFRVQRSPRGRLLALSSKPLISAVPASAAARELNIYGAFEQGPWKTDAEILAAIHSNTDDWFPGGRELRQFAKSGKGVVEGVVNVWNLLCSIARNHPSRVNIFTHATGGYIGLSGRVVKGNVYFSKKADAELSDEIISNAEKDAYTFSDSKSKNVTMQDVRAALQKNAVMIIYACHSGLHKDYLQKLSQVFRIRVKGFPKEIRYYPVSRDGKISKWQYSHENSKKVEDFHGLDDYAIEVSP